MRFGKGFKYQNSHKYLTFYLNTKISVNAAALDGLVSVLN